MSCGDDPPLAQPIADSATAATIVRMIREWMFELRMMGSRLMAHSRADGPVLFLFTFAV
jgi:hypothetical protein